MGDQILRTIKRFFLAAALGSITVSPATAAKQPDAPLKREGKWVMDYADNACHLVAAFGSPADRVVAKFSQAGPGQPLQLALLGKSLAKGKGVFAQASVTFFPAAGPSKWVEITKGSVTRPDGELPAVFVRGVRLDNSKPDATELSSVPPVEAETEKAVYALSYSERGGTAFTLDLQSMGAPMAAMRKCIDNLVRQWGFDPVELATRQSRAVPRGNPATWATTADYPSKMTIKGASAFVTFRVALDEAGTVTDCFVLETTSPPEIGPHTCGLIKKRARFTPSRDMDDKPAKDYYINRVFWRAGG